MCRTLCCPSYWSRFAVFQVTCKSQVTSGTLSRQSYTYNPLQLPPDVQNLWLHPISDLSFSGLDWSEMTYSTVLGFCAPCNDGHNLCLQTTTAVCTCRQSHTQSAKGGLQACHQDCPSPPLLLWGEAHRVLIRIITELRAVLGGLNGCQHHLNAKTAISITLAEQHSCYEAPWMGVPKGLAFWGRCFKHPFSEASENFFRSMYQQGSPA